MTNKNIKKSFMAISSIALALGILVITPSISNAAGAQDSVITDLVSPVCSTTTGYIANIEGIFPSPVTKITINGSSISPTRWEQTLINIAVAIPATTQKTFKIAIYNGLTPSLTAQAFTCGKLASVVNDNTEIGGVLPNTATNNYNNLLIGFTLSLLGMGGILMRKRVNS